MTTQIDYEAIARENGYYVVESIVSGLYRYVKPNRAVSWQVYTDKAESYKACCVENNLVEGE